MIIFGIVFMIAHISAIPAERPHPRRVVYQLYYLMVWNFKKPKLQPLPEGRPLGLKIA
jgi:hypothetical protein